MLLTRITSRGVDYEVEVDSMGKFSAVVDGTTIRCETLEGLQDRVDMATKELQNKVAVPFMILEDVCGAYETVKYGVITGIHIVNGNALVKYDNGKREQVYKYKRMMHNTPELKAQYVALCKAESSAKKARESFERANAIDVETAVRKAMDAVSKGAKV